MKLHNEIPYNRPFIVGKELYNIAKAVIVNRQLSGGGPFSRECESWLEANIGCRKALLTHSCTAALEMASILCDVGPGDEIIMPSFTFVSTANAFVLRGGVPVFVDIRPDTLNINEQLIGSAITKKTRMIVPVHYAGGPCEMNIIMDIAREHNLFVVEDAAQALLSTYRGKYLGSIGSLGCLSFHETKNIISGEGGALLINEPSLIERAEIIREKGTDRSRFFRGEVDKYTWQDTGSSFLPCELVSAFLSAQLEHAERIIAARRALFSHYFKSLKHLEDRGFIRLPYIDHGSSCNGHIFYFITNNNNERTEVISYLKAKNIHCIFHYIPLHSSPAGQKFARTATEMTNTDTISETIIRVPLFYEMTLSDVDQVCEEINSFYTKAH